MSLEPAVTSATPRLRTCIATRSSQPDTELLRVVARIMPDGTVIAQPDPHRRLPGRGAWITPTLESLETAEKRQAFRRALRVSTKVDTGEVRKYLSDVETSQPSIVRKTEH